jgi:hypothetical protein
MPRVLAPSLLALVLLASCGKDDRKSCDPVAGTGCSASQVCETVENGGTPACFDPVVLAGKVFDLSTQAAVAGARVVALDPNRAPVTSVATSGTDGGFALPLPRQRKADGTPTGGPVTLRADAKGYQSFPAGLRVALPVDTSAATHASGAWTVQSSLTDVGLIALAAGAGTGSIRGSVAVPADHGGVLVVAETGSPARGTTAIADRDGAFAIFNLAPGSYAVTAYARGQNYTPAQVTVQAGQDTSTSLSIAGAAAASVGGSVQIVNGGQGTATSVILVVESTFDPVLIRGDAPPGLRAPDAGVAPNVTGAFSISGVPDGRYVALAAFENDLLVRDPDTCISGTQIVHVAVLGGSLQGSAPGFKVTGALDVITPGASGPEQVTSAPSFSWKDDSGEASYDVVVFDALGNVVWQVNIPGVSGRDPSVTYGQTSGVNSTTVAAQPLRSGMYYQFRATSKNGSGCPLSQTEDLKGVFYLP